MSKPPPGDSIEKLWKPKNAEEARQRELLWRGDRVGLRYLRAEQLKRKRKPSRDERKYLKEFEAGRKRIARDPEAVWKEGFAKAHEGIMLLETLLHEKRRQNIPETTDPAAYNAFCCLSMLAANLREDFVRYAEDGSEVACDVVFREGKAFASAFSRLAIAYPQHFREIAEKSLTMPSLRARNPSFTCDAEAIIRAVHLAEKHHANNLHDNRTRIGALCHQFVAEMVDLVEAVRLELTERGDTNHRLARLPELKGNAVEWWRMEIKDRVHREFAKMKNNPRRNPALWEELEGATDHGTDAAKRAAFEKYCFNKLAQIAGRPTTRG